MKFLLSLLTLFLACSAEQAPNNIAQKEQKSAPNDINIEKSGEYRIIHVFVALCDNEFQGIVKVPPKIGNGKDPENNLYWGCGYGTKTFFKKHPNWKWIQTLKNPKEKVLERCIFKHKEKKVYLVADAYDGEHIRHCTSVFLQSCAGDFADFFVAGADTIACGGAADLSAYIGHNGLMDFDLEESFEPANALKREAIVLACISRDYFKPRLMPTGAKPLLLTTGFMAPEAYTLAAAVDGWVEKKDAAAIREAAAQAYHKYQKCGVRAARKLLVTE